MKYLITSLFIFAGLTFNTVYSQDDDLIFGKTPKLNSAALFDLSDPNGVNIEVNLWGYVRYPGKYRIPLNTTFLDVITYAGGPIENSNMEDIRILRTSDNAGGKSQIIKLNYNDLLWDEQVSTKPKNNPILKAGDIIVVIEERRYSFRENISFFLPIITSVLSIATLIVTLQK